MEGPLLDLLPVYPERLWKSAKMNPEFITINKEKWLRMDVDMSIFDNADTKKEGALVYLQQTFWLWPIFAHLGGGWMVRAQLRPGSAHSYSEGTLDFITRSVDAAHAMVEKVPIVLVGDGGMTAKSLSEGLTAKSAPILLLSTTFEKSLLCSGWNAPRQRRRRSRNIKINVNRERSIGAVYSRRLKALRNLAAWFSK
jgi:hypothetical protein